ncbi:uncharacterized protein LOC120203853 [Hibiscus syriacus]|uniref:uncharacterized protein LOC120203853 n=1 Tax=Hibiscus syriacus TaxID=106335 RepID=UPI0019239625|nr:uncharacterized protein LOC120203853 [Hibiscus syriacus]
MREGDEWKTAFKTKQGLYECKSLSEHAEHLRIILSTLRGEHLYANLKKCAFCTNQVTFLGFIVSSQGLAVDPEKIKAIQEWPEPVNKNSNFCWGKEQDEAFKELKDYLTKAPLLALPNFDKTFEVECDASGIGIGAVLSQEGKPIAYFSEKLNGVTLNYPVYDKEIDGKDKAEFVKKLHQQVKDNIERRTRQYEQQSNKGRKKVTFEAGYWVWVHFRKERFPNQRKSKLLPRGDGPFQIMEKINDNAYKLEFPGNTKFMSHDERFFWILEYNSTINTSSGPLKYGQTLAAHSIT